MADFMVARPVKRARKLYNCVDCGQLIQPGTPYVRLVGRSDEFGYGFVSWPACTPNGQCERPETFAPGVTYLTCTCGAATEEGADGPCVCEPREVER